MDNLNVRQKKMLWVVVKEYIASAEPVGSSLILDKHCDLDCSSATVRKELSFLEDAGFLTHPHTSAGRVPTDKGYRFYVNNLMKAYQLSMREKTLVDHLASALQGDVENIMEETVRTLNSISSYATIMKTDNALLAEVLGDVKKSISRAKKESLYLSGLAKMLYEPEFDDVANVRKITGLLEEKEKFGKILDEYSDAEKVSVSIGSEMKEDDLTNYSLITKEFHCKGESIGQIGIIGPTRMQYAKVTKTIDTIAVLLDNFFEEI